MSEAFPSADGGTEVLDTDVLVVGAGMSGLAVAAALATAGVGVILVDRAPRSRLVDLAYDGRTTAVALGSRRIFDGLGAWEAMAPAAEPILDIRVSDGDSPLFLHYDHREVGDEPMGYIVENRVIREALFRRVEALDSATVLAETGLADVERERDDALARLDDGRNVRCRLIVAADGRNSRMREAAGITSFTRRYRQTSIVCIATHARPHRGIAHERFLPAGPFAILPFTDDPDPPSPVRHHRSSIVWTEDEVVATRLLEGPRERLETALALRFGDFLGRVGISGDVWSYPLELRIARRTTDERLALVGDAAHVIHPIAGQGFNLGLRDVAVLAEEVVDAFRAGLDPGAGDVLARHAARRRFDVAQLVMATDGLNRLFSNSFRPLALARGLGLAAVGRTAPLRHFFMRHAMGTLGDLPRLARGEPI